ncbi:hypothetical protein OROGR_008822 [Orobanche gracilis]
MSETNHTVSDGGHNCCAKAKSELKLYQAFIFSVPIFFTFVLLLLFYLLYLRRRRRRAMRNSSLPSLLSTNVISRCEMGLTKELREMLPIVVFKESFSVKETQCSVCLSDYQSDEKLQQIPSCGHTFHMECIDLWLATHTTCPLCRQCLLLSAKVTDGEVQVDDIQVENNIRSETSLAVVSRSINDDPETSQQLGSTDRRDGNETLQPGRHKPL